MPELELTEVAEETLSSLWLSCEERGQEKTPAPDTATLRELVDAGLVHGDDGTISLTPAGGAEAAGIVRRERLAERLLVDVLNVSDGLVAQAACKFEHFLRRGIDDRICTLLGHPRACPHGSPIPEGPCCRAGSESAGRVVSRLADLEPGQVGVIAYIQSQRREFLQRLLAMGALPGAPIVLRQRFPSYVFDLGQGQVAIDAETARDIYVRLHGETRETPRHRWPLRAFRGLRIRLRSRRG